MGKVRKELEKMEGRTGKRLKNNGDDQRRGRRGIQSKRGRNLRID